MSVDIDYVREQFNHGAEVVYSEERVALSDYAAQHGIERVDVLKIDTDGADYGVLLSAEAMLGRVRPLWVEIEANLAESGMPLDAPFCDIDRLMRGLGFTLVDLAPWRYSRAALPQPFAYEIPAQTVSGPVAWADATYVDDPLRLPGKLDQWLESEAGLRRAVKLATLYDVFGLADCAAELLLALSQHPASADRADWAAMLNLVTPTTPFGAQTYDEYLAAFARDPDALLPSRTAVETFELSNAYLTMERDLQVALRNVERRKRRMLLLSTRTVAAQAETERFRSRLNTVERERETLSIRAAELSDQITAGQAELQRATIEAKEREQALIEQRAAEAARFQADLAAIDAAHQERLKQLEAVARAREAEITAKFADATALIEARDVETRREMVTERQRLLRDLTAGHQLALKALRNEFENERREQHELTAALQRDLQQQLHDAREDAGRRQAELVKAAAEQAAAADARLRDLQAANDALRDRLASRDAAILAAAREAWSLDPDERGDVFEVLDRARRGNEALRRERIALQSRLDDAERTREQMVHLLSRSARFTLHRWLSLLLRKDVMKSLPAGGGRSSRD